MTIDKYEKHDLILISTGNYIQIGIIKKIDSYTLHYYPLTEWGYINFLSNGITYINSVHYGRIRKISKKTLNKSETEIFKKYQNHIKIKTY